MIKITPKLTLILSFLYQKQNEKCDYHIHT